MNDKDMCLYKTHGTVPCVSKMINRRTVITVGGLVFIINHAKRGCDPQLVAVCNHAKGVDVINPKTKTYTALSRDDIQFVFAN